FVDRLDLHHVAGLRRHDHEPVPGVDPDVVDGVVEGEQIPGPGVGQAGHRLADLGLVGGGPGEVDTELPVDVLDEAGAVEAGRRGAAPDVGHAEELLGDVDGGRQPGRYPGGHI